MVPLGGTLTMRTSFMLAAIASLALVSSPSSAEDAVPFSTWIVAGAAEGGPKFVSAAGKTPLGTVGGWTCEAVLEAIEPKDGHRRDHMTVSCTSDKGVFVRTMAWHTEGFLPGEPTPLQIVSGGATGKPVRTILFGPK